MRQAKFLSTVDVARLFRVPLHRIRYLVQSGKLPDDGFQRMRWMRVWTKRDVRRVAKLLDLPVPEGFGGERLEAKR